MFNVLVELILNVLARVVVIVNLLVRSLYVTVIPKKLLIPLAYCAFNAVRKVVTV